MLSLVFALDAVLVVLRTLVFAAAIAVAALAVLSAAVRARRLNPFGGVGRFVRGTVDPLFLPMERRLVRAGGRPTHAPWWTLAAIVVGGLVLLYLLGFVRDQIALLGGAAQVGGRALVLLLVSWTFAVLQIALFVRVGSSWFSVSPWSRWVRWSYALTDWIVGPLRQVVPPLGMLDITPIVAYFALVLLERIVVGVLASAL